MRAAVVMGRVICMHDALGRPSRDLAQVPSTLQVGREPGRNIIARVDGHTVHHQLGGATCREDGRLVFRRCAVVRARAGVHVVTAPVRIEIVAHPTKSEAGRPSQAGRTCTPASL